MTVNLGAVDFFTLKKLVQMLPKVIPLHLNFDCFRSTFPEHISNLYDFVLALPSVMALLRILNNFYSISVPGEIHALPHVTQLLKTGGIQKIFILGLKYIVYDCNIWCTHITNLQARCLSLHSS